MTILVAPPHSPQSKQRRTWLIILAIFFAGAASIFFHEKGSTAVTSMGSNKASPGADLGAEKFSDALSIGFGSDTYTIPRKYLSAARRPSAQDPRASFTLYLLLPKLEPKTAANASQFGQPGWKDQLLALVQYGSAPLPKEDVLRSYLRLAKKTEGEFQLLDGRYRFYYLAHNSPTEIYTADTPHGLFLFTCNRPDEYPPPFSPYCTVIESLGDNTGINYAFGRDHRFEALEIDNKLRELLGAFRHANHAGSR